MSNPGETTREMLHVPKDQLDSVLAGIRADPLFISVEEPVLEENGDKERYTIRATYRELPERPT